MKSEIILHDHSVTFETNEPVVEKDGLVVNIVGGIGPRGTKGDKGDTPVKGVDYFTDEDIDEISDAAASKVHVPTSVSELANDAGYLTEHQDISGKADKDEIPTRVSELENDAGYLTEHQDVSGKADKSELPTRVSELENDAGYLTEHQDVSHKADKSEIPVNVSELVNDAGYLTQHQDISNKAEKSEIPTRVSELENDTGYITGYTETDPTVPAWAKNAVKPTYTASEVGALPDNTHIPSTTGELENDAEFITAEDLPVNVSELVNDAGYLTQHQDISGKADKSEIPVNVSQLTNDAGYLTEHQDISSKADKSEIPINVSELTNDAGYLTTETDPTVPAWAKAAQKPAYTAAEVGATTEQEVSSMIADAMPDVPVQDVQVDGSSVLDNGVASIEAATSSKAGVVIVNPSYGMYMTNRHIVIQPQNDATIKNGTWSYGAITPSTQHKSAFYGLAKAAGDTTQSQSDNAVGSYTDDAKAAIQTMLDVPSKSDIPEVPVQDVRVNDASIVNDGTANVALGSGLTSMVNPLTNIQTLVVQSANSTRIKNGTELFYPIAPARQHESTFYGLAKAAGDTSQSVSSNTVGTYTNEAKAAIQSMLDVPSNTDLAQAISDVEEKIQHMYICSAAEYNSETGVPTVASPNSKMFYLVPSSEGSPNLYIEWVYLNNTWERFGSATVDLTNYVQFDDYATANKAGVIRVGAGLQMAGDGQRLYTKAASSSQLKSGNIDYNPVVPYLQHYSAFYGLAKAAGHDEKDSTEPLGTYTQEAKTAIQQMLDVPSNSDIPDVSVYATKADTVLETTLSRGRKAGTTVGNSSMAFGNDVEASGAYSFAVGYRVAASGAYSYAGGYSSKALSAASFTIGQNTIAAGSCSFVNGQYNTVDDYNNWAEWEANKEYTIGDKVKRTVTENNETIVYGYIAKKNSNRSSFLVTDWKEDHMLNYVHVTGNGTNDNARSNAYALDWDGNGHYMGDVYVGANADSSGGERLAKESELGLKVVRLI